LLRCEIGIAGSFVLVIQSGIGDLG
jgi:hypothetical protein